MANAQEEDAANKPFIVVGVDGSEASVEALRWAVRHARTTHARLEVIGAWETPWAMMVAPTKTDEDYFREARARLEPAIARGLEGSEDVQSTVRIVEWYPGPALVQAAAGADLLVVGSHRYGVMEGVHLGSVASYCAHHASCPVLIHRHSPGR